MSSIRKITEKINLYLRRGIFPVCLALGALLQLSAIAGEGNYLLRFPDVHGSTVVFVSGGDIWSAPISGGVARRLTVSDGEEEFPKFSPDGSLIAFTGQYDGNTDVYVMNPDGGNITRLTYHPGSDEVVGWHPQKNKILFRSTRNSFQRYTRLYLISPDGSGLEELVLIEASQGSFSPDGKQIAYNKVAREHRTWKRYRGGLAQEVYIYDFETNRERNITNFPGTDRLPMWIGNKIFFSSDRDGMLNIYVYDVASGQINPVTSHKDYDVRRPSAGNGMIVYELGGDIWLLNSATGADRKIDIEVRADAPEVRPYYKDVADDITGYSISPSGQRALVVARGEVFSVPREHGPTRNLTNSNGVREKDAVWSPDGKTIAYFSDARGNMNSTSRMPGAKKRRCASPNIRTATATPCAGRRTARRSPSPTRPSPSIMPMPLPARSPKWTRRRTRMSTSPSIASRSPIFPGRRTAAISPMPRWMRIWSIKSTSTPWAAGRSTA